MKLLLDENLSPRVATQLQGEGVDAIHVRERGMLGATDHAVLDRAFVEDRILVTMNVADFVKLAAARDIHAGIVVITPGGLTRAEQLTVLHAAIERLADTDLVNHVLHADLDGTMELEALPK